MIKAFCIFSAFFTFRLCTQFESLWLVTIQMNIWPTKKRMLLSSLSGFFPLLQLLCFHLRKVLCLHFREKAEPFPWLRFDLFLLCSGTHITVLRLNISLLLWPFHLQFPCKATSWTRFFMNGKGPGGGNLVPLLISWFWCVWREFLFSVAERLLEMCLV